MRRPEPRRCSCHRDGASRTLLRWPVSIALASSFRHNANCPLATSQEVMRDLRLELSIYSFLLRKQFKIALGYQSNASSISIANSLQCIRFVTKDSPGFRLLEDLITSNEGSEWKIHFSKLDDCANRMYRLFETRQASPSDRLLDGRTLLHFVCDITTRFLWRRISDSQISEQATTKTKNMVVQLFNYMPLQMNETDKRGRTVLDFIVTFVPGVYLSAFLDLFRYDVPITRHPSSIMLPITDEMSHGIRLILLRARDDFYSFIQETKGDPSLLGNFTLYELATRVGWLEGCQIMHEAGMSLRKDKRLNRRILIIAVYNEDASMVRFWLGARKTMDKAGLEDIGDLAEAYCHAASCFPNETIPNILLADLVQQRRAIKDMIEKHGVELMCSMRPDTLPDAHVHCCLSALEERGVEVPAALYPITERVYCAQNLKKVSYAGAYALERLFDSGFEDVFGEKVPCHRGTAGLSPVVCFAAFVNLGNPRRIDGHDVLKWLLEKGANLKERCDGWSTTAAHFIADQIHLGPRLHDTLDPLEVSALLTDSPDDYTCFCSSRGCLPITAFWKASFVNDIGYRTKEESSFTEWEVEKQRSSILRTIDKIRKCTDTGTHRWIIPEIIRSILFLLLGMRHTCCNIADIAFQITRETEKDPQDQTIRRTLNLEDRSIHQSANYIQRVKKEDAYLISLLEQLIPEFDTAFDAFKGNLTEFVDTQMWPRMMDILQKLKEEDKVKFGQKRWEMGVVMETDGEEDDEISTNEADDESGVLDTIGEDLDSEDD